MNPCAKNRKSIALLALDELGGESSRELRTHLETCEGCRRYYDELSNVTGTLALLETDQNIRTSATFHRRVVNALRTEAPVRKEGALERFLLSLTNHPAAWKAAGALAVLIAALVLIVPAHRAPLPVPATAPAPIAANIAPPGNVSADMEPTIANYQMVADRSLDKLDDLLTRQGNRNPPPAPIYTASDFARVNLN
jgi:hypothetical protein